MAKRGPESEQPKEVCYANVFYLHAWRCDRRAAASERLSPQKRREVQEAYRKGLRDGQV